jgi:hypothetical protein
MRWCGRLHVSGSSSRRERLEAFAAAIRDGLEALDFAGRQRLVRLLVERVIVLGEDVTIEHVVPLSGRFAVCGPMSEVLRGGPLARPGWEGMEMSGKKQAALGSHESGKGP